VKFLVDMPLSPTLAEYLRTLDQDAVHANELSLNHAPDDAILKIAASQERVIVTADLDFPRLFAQLKASSPGLILLRGGNFSESQAIDCIRRVLFSVQHDELPRSVVVVDLEKVRRRCLPI